MENNKEHSARSIVSDGLTIAIVTAYVYLATFAYEYGYCAYFGIPLSLIAPNLSTLLAAAVALGSVLATLLTAVSFSQPILSIFRAPTGRVERVVWTYLGFVFIILALGKAIYALSWAQLGAGFLALMFVVLLILLPTFIFDRKKPYRERIESYLTGDGVSSESIEAAVFSRVNRNVGQMIFVAVVCLMIANLIGDGEARRRAEFLTVKGEDDTVVLRNYGDLMIGAKFSREKREVSNELRLFSLGEKKRIDFFVEKIGPLRPEVARGEKAVAVPSPRSTASSSAR